MFECEGLQQADWVGGNDCYAVVTANGIEKSTQTVYSGGASPVWAKGAGESLTWGLSTAPHSITITVRSAFASGQFRSLRSVFSCLCYVARLPPQIFDEDNHRRNQSKDDRLGSARIPISQASASQPKAPWDDSGWFQLTGAEGGRCDLRTAPASSARSGCAVAVAAAVCADLSV